LNEDIQRSFSRKEYGAVGSYVETITRDNERRCHIYSLPYQFKSFGYLNNSFQGGMFDNVQSFILTDFCHLPCLEYLKIGYESLVLVTNNFTKDDTRLTCSKLISLDITELFVPSKLFQQYFPLL